MLKKYARSLVTVMLVLAMGPAMAEPTIFTIDFAPIVADVADALFEGIEGIFGDLTPIILAGLSVTIGFIMFRVLKRGIRTFSS